MKKFIIPFFFMIGLVFTAQAKNIDWAALGAFELGKVFSDNKQLNELKTHISNKYPEVGFIVNAKLDDIATKFNSEDISIEELTDALEEINDLDLEINFRFFSIDYNYLKDEILAAIHAKLTILCAAHAPSVPIDGGLAFLAVAGVGVAARKLYRK